MSACEVLSARASDGVAPALRAVDCLAGETVANAFGRLFGQNGTQGGGALLPALTIVLTLYIAFFAFSLLTGRSRLGVSALTPRMLTVGLVLTFATSWVAYSQVVWNLTTGAPDEIASVLTGANGSATQIFGDRVDMVFGAIAEAADAGQQEQAVQAGAQAAGAAASGNFTPGNLMWLGALLLLLATVGVLVTARIALAVLLAVGPGFVIFAWVDATRGRFVGWLRGLVLTAVTTVFGVVGGGVVLELLVPVVSSLRGEAAMGEAISGRAALALFVIACVHVALMALALRVSGTIVSGWQVFGLARRRHDGFAPAFQPATAMAVTPVLPAAAMPVGRHMAPMPPPGAEVLQASLPDAAGTAASIGRVHIAQVSTPAQAGLPPLPRARARGIGSRFAAPQTTGRTGVSYR
jgi:type IV secretion system protein VirB6